MRMEGQYMLNNMESRGPNHSMVITTFDALKVGTAKGKEVSDSEMASHSLGLDKYQHMGRN